MTVARALRKQLERENREWPDVLSEVPRERWLPKSWDTTQRIRVLRSRGFLVQVFEEAAGVLRLSVNRTTAFSGPETRWKDGITWDELQDLKAQAGYGDRLAVEIYPPEHDLVTSANMRHLWVLPSWTLAFGWRRTS